MASLFVKDTEANAMAVELAGRCGLSKTAAVRLALRHELDRDAPSLRDQLAAFHAAHPMEERTGFVADKAFYDALNDEDAD